ncbi:MAG: amidohydrolase [Candidatus Omnitrophota bacterium]
MSKSTTKYTIISTLLFIFVFVQFDFDGSAKESKNLNLKKEAFQKVDQLSETLNDAAKKIWEFAEIHLAEYKSSKLLADLLEQNGFNIQPNAGGLPTAFVATYGTGQPVIGILGEFDALPGLSQKDYTLIQEPVTPKAPGHGCGHNLFGVGSAGAAIAIKTVMEQHHLKGTVKFFGCPSEETAEGKIYMARDGVFLGLDICLDWHPSDENDVSMETSNALNNFEVIFHGKTAHAAGDPWNGRGALDAVELMDIGVNYMREHVPVTVRMHYVIADGGRAPNIVPDTARAWYFVRGKDRHEVEDVYARVLKIAEGAALMTDTTHEIRFITGIYNYLKNNAIGSVMHQNLQLVNVPAYTPEEQEFAKQLQKKLGKKEQGMSTKIKPFTGPKEYMGGGSTDAADVSWLVPTVSLGTACMPMEIPGHHWGVVACVASSLGYKGMQTASKVLAATAIDALTDPSVIKKAREEFKEKTKDFVYKSALPAGQKPPVVENK